VPSLPTADVRLVGAFHGLGVLGAGGLEIGATSIAGRPRPLVFHSRGGRGAFGNRCTDSRAVGQSANGTCVFHICG
jgi:hypothetical protein